MRKIINQKKIDLSNNFRKTDLKLIKTDLKYIKRLLDQKDYQFMNRNLDDLIDRVSKWIEKIEKEER